MISEDAWGVEVEWGPGSVKLISLVDDWCARVLKLAQDATGEPDAPEAWTAWDLIGAYFLRDAIEEAYIRSRQPGDDTGLPTLAAADALLKSFSGEDVRCALRRLVPDEYGEGWWWRCLPRNGPIAAEMGYPYS